MKYNIIIKLTLLISLFVSKIVFAQNPQTSKDKSITSQINNQKKIKDSIPDNFDENCIYLGAGIGGIYFPAYIYYEKSLQNNFLGSRLFSSFVTFGTGIAAHWDGESSYVSSKFGLLLGEKKAHLETAIGVCYFYDGDLKGAGLPLAISVGYRSQNPGKKFVFRTGISWPEALYLSWGFRF